MVDQTKVLVATLAFFLPLAVIGALIWYIEIIEARKPHYTGELTRICADGTRIYRLPDGHYALSDGTKVAGLEICR
jgi:hypothetical protein